MPLISVLRNDVRLGAVARYERLVRFVAARAREDKQTIRWTARSSIGAEGARISFVAAAEGWAELAAREQTDALIRRLFGEGDGNAILEALGEGIVSSATLVSSVREDLSSQAVPQPGQAPVLALVTRLRTTPGGGRACEELVRLVVEAARKVDAQRLYLVLQPVIGELGGFTVVQPIADPAQLDRQQALPDLLTAAYGQKEADRILREGMACIASADSELSTHRPELSNP